ncbi:MAG TPA: ABC transporter permease [Candidatus Saccharimonadales bacterium]|nr:ABC transporter permease [Candidatus Saccharimonadales bacterium]
MKTYLSKQNRVLLAELVRTDFKLRYQGSILGYAWSLLKPLLLFIILYIVFVYFLKIGKDVQHFPVYLLLGIVLWNFFVEMTSQSLGSIVGRGDLIRKIRIPRWIIVFSSSLSALINLTINLVVVFAFAIINGVDFSVTALLLPLNIIEIYIFSLGVSLFLAAAYVKFRDISYIWEVILQAGFYATPIIYPLALVTNTLVQKLLLLNPMAQAIQDARYNLVTHQTLTAHTLIGNTWMILTPFILTILIFIGGVFYFKKQSRTFAENI